MVTGNEYFFDNINEALSMFWRLSNGLWHKTHTRRNLQWWCVKSQHDEKPSCRSMRRRLWMRMGMRRNGSSLIFSICWRVGRRTAACLMRNWKRPKRIVKKICCFLRCRCLSPEVDAGLWLLCCLPAARWTHAVIECRWNSKGEEGCGEGEIIN